MQINEASLNQKEQAFYYLDACFILAYLDSDDVCGEKVAEMLDEWSKNKSKVCISNQTFIEVCHTRFKRNIIHAIKLVDRDYSRIQQYGIKSLSNDTIDLLIEPNSAKYLHSIAKKNGFFQNRNKFVGDVNELVKIVKERDQGRQQLKPFYQSAVDKYNEFNKLLIELEVEPKFLTSGIEECNLAQQFMITYQLDSSDALHLAIAKNNSVDALVTLDSDFEHLNSEINVPKIMKIA